MAEIKHYVTPAFLYRYRSINNTNIDNELGAVENNYIWTASYAEMNDPMEGLYTSSKLLQSDVEFETLSNSVAQAKGAIGIASFSENFDHELMWAHYANQFRGICIGYNVRKLIKGTMDGTELTKVTYSQNTPKLLRSHRRGMTPLVAKEILSQKNYRWQYESGWRLFQNGFGAARYNGMCCSRIIVGSRISRAHLRQV